MRGVPTPVEKIIDWVTRDGIFITIIKPDYPNNHISYFDIIARFFYLMFQTFRNFLHKKKWVEKNLSLVTFPKLVTDEN
jgi:hypothetical protein